MTNPIEKFQILITADLTEQGLSILRGSDDIEIQQVNPTNAQALREKLQHAHALIARDDVVIDRALLDCAPILRVIGRVGASLSGIDVDTATSRGIIVMNTPGVNAVAAGELAVTMMLALSRNLIDAHTSLKSGYWLLDRKRQAGTQLLGKTLGVVGLGRVGSIVAQRCLGFGMNVLAYDPYIGDDQLDDKRVMLVGLRELLSKSDFVSLHIPATVETRGFFSETLISQMKPGARLINTAHGSVLNEAALVAALKSGHLGGAALDVYAEEPPYNSPLIGMSNVIHTPHIGDNTAEATGDLSILIVTQVLDALRGEDYRNVVNMPFVPGMNFETTRPYLQLAERIGTLIHTLARNPVRRVAVEYRGDDVNVLIKPVTVAILKGLLAPVLADGVNYINAPLLAVERGIGVTQAKGLKSADYASIVLCQATLEDGEEITLAGTLLDRREPHIVQINDYRMNFVPEGHMLIMGSFDQPGVIGRIGTLMAENEINIGSWQTGRSGPGGHTLTVLTLDDALSDDLMRQLTSLDFVRHAHQVQL